MRDMMEEISPTQWEYEILLLSGKHHKEALDELGKEGWELVTVTQFSPLSTVAFLKRPLT